MNVLAELACLRDGTRLVPVAEGRILAGREGSVILRCTSCGYEHHLYVSLSLVGENVDTFISTNRRAAVCGTESGYSRHRANGTPPCELCATAHREGNRRRAKREPVAV